MTVTPTTSRMLLLEEKRNANNQRLEYVLDYIYPHSKQYRDNQGVLKIQGKLHL